MMGGGDVAWLEVVVTSVEVVGFKRLIILSLALDMEEVVSSACNTSATISPSPLVASRIFTSNAVIRSCLRWSCSCISQSNHVVIAEGSGLDNSSSADCKSFLKCVR